MVSPCRAARLAGAGADNHHRDEVKMPLGTDFYDWLLFFHILGVALWLGGLVVASVFGTLVLRSRDLALVGRFTASLGIVGAILGTSMLAVLAFGIWLVVRSDAWNFGQAWVIAGLGLFAAAFPIRVAL